MGNTIEYDPLERKKQILFYGICFLIILYFIGKCCYIAWTVKEGIPPDESMHISVIRGFQNSSDFFMDPTNMNPGYAGVTSQSKFFYHLIMANTFGHLGVFKEDIFAFRLVNIGLGLINIYFFYKLLLQLFKDKFSIVCALFCYTNILMFTFLSASVSYDNLINLLAIAFIYVVLKHSRNPRVENHLILVSLLLIGSITKPSFWPFSVPYFVLVLYDLYRVKIIFPLLKEYYENIISFRRLMVLFIVTSLMLFFLTVLVKNNSHYGKALHLNCVDIYGVEVCKSNDQLANVYRNLRQINKGNERESVLGYYDEWIDLIIQRSFGILAGQKMEMSKGEFQAIKLILLLGLILFLSKIRQSNNDVKLLFGFFFFYFLVIFFYVNYRGYVGHGQIDAMVHGRYLFPVLGCFVILLIYSCISTWSSVLTKYFFSIPILIIFFWLDMPSYYTDIEKPYFNKNIYPEYRYKNNYIKRKGEVKVTLDSYNEVGINDDPQLIEWDQGMNGITFKGWALNIEGKELLGEVLFSVNDGIDLRANYGFRREDVAIVYLQRELIKCGFSVFIPASEFDKGKNDIQIKMIDKKGRLFEEIRVFEIEVN